MGWLSMITGLFRPAKELIEVFKPNAEGEAQRGHAERMALSAQDLASLEQFAAEFQPRANRTWWDSFIDGLNRVPRPLITLGVLAFFVLAPLDPLRFAQIARAYELMPDGFWALLSIIVAFYFGGRMQLKRQDMAIKGGALEVAREVMALQREARDAAAPGPDVPTPSSDADGLMSLPSDSPRGNRVIEAWKRQRALAPGG